MTKRAKALETSTLAERDPILDAIVGDLQKSLAKSKNGHVSLMGDALFKSEPTVWVPTGIPLLDRAICLKAPGGLPGGRFTEISGDEVTGKSLLILSILQAALEAGGHSIYIDGEVAGTHDFTKTIARVDTNRLICFDEVETVEDMFTHAALAAKTVRDRVGPQALIAIGLDGLAISCREELERDLDEEAKVAAHSKAVGRGIKKFLASTAKDNIVFLWTNQMRSTIGGGPFAPKSQTTGGKAPRYFASTRIELKHIQNLVRGEKKDMVGQVVEATVRKTRFGPGGLKVAYPIYSRMHDPLGIDGVESTTKFLEYRGILGKGATKVHWRGEDLKKADFIARCRTDAAFYADVVQRAVTILTTGLDEGVAPTGLAPDDLEAGVVEGEA